MIFFQSGWGKILSASSTQYAIVLNLNWLNDNYPINVKKYMMLSADRDILPADVLTLKKKYNGIAADWESG